MHPNIQFAYMFKDAATSRQTIRDLVQAAGLNEQELYGTMIYLAILETSIAEGKESRAYPLAYHLHKHKLTDRRFLDALRTHLTKFTDDPKYQDRRISTHPYIAQLMVTPYLLDMEDLARDTLLVTRSLLHHETDPHIGIGVDLCNAILSATSAAHLLFMPIDTPESVLRNMDEGLTSLTNAMLRYERDHDLD